MKVIEVPERSWSTRLTCRNNECRALLELEPEDVLARPDGVPRAYSQEPDFHVNCPVCGAKCYLNTHGAPLPNWVKAIAKAKNTAPTEVPA